MRAGRLTRAAGFIGAGDVLLVETRRGAAASTAAALRDSRVTPCPLYTPKITLNQPPRVATLAMG